MVYKIEGSGFRALGSRVSSWAKGSCWIHSLGFFGWAKESRWIHSIGFSSWAKRFLGFRMIFLVGPFPTAGTAGIPCQEEPVIGTSQGLGFKGPQPVLLAQGLLMKNKITMTTSTNPAKGLRAVHGSGRSFHDDSMSVMVMMMMMLMMMVAMMMASRKMTMAQDIVQYHHGGCSYYDGRWNDVMRCNAEDGDDHQYQ